MMKENSKQEQSNKLLVKMLKRKLYDLRFKNKNIIEETMTQSQLAEPEKIARDCFKKKYKNCQS